MCNLYSHTKGPAAIVALTRAMRDLAGNLPPQPAIYPDYAAPVVRNAPDGVRELAMLRWGMPTPPAYIKGKTDKGVTNIRNVKSPHWRRWLKQESRCVVPFTAFSEWGTRADGSNGDIWFGFVDEPEASFFAGVWTTWTGVRKLKEGSVTIDVFGFLTTAPNAEVAAIHPKAMPVILTHPQEIERWMTAPAEDALALQRPLPDGVLKIVATGSRSDAPAGVA